MFCPADLAGFLAVGLGHSLWLFVMAIAVTMCDCSQVDLQDCCEWDAWQHWHVVRHSYLVNHVLCSVHAAL